MSTAIAAYEQFGKAPARPVIVVDFGTATTLDAISAKGEYLGGAICPGVQISADALFQRTARLPRIEVRKPACVIGRTTVGAMESGLFYGYVGMVEGLVRRMSEELGGGPRVCRHRRACRSDRVGNPAHSPRRSRPDAAGLENRVGTNNLIEDYCHEIEAYLCRKNDGHLIRIVGPSFELVSGWADRGLPLKIAYRGIDRYFERYYRKGPRRRPVRIDFCEPDVLEAFDDWRRAVGVAASTAGGLDEAEAAPDANADRRGPSLPAHLERVVMRLTAARVNGGVGQECDDLIDRVARELDAARSVARGVRGDARRALVNRLSELDAELLQTARATLDEATRVALTREAEAELSGFRDRMAPDAFARSRDAAVDRLVRERLGLPILAFR